MVVLPRRGPRLRATLVVAAIATALSIPTVADAGAVVVFDDEAAGSFGFGSATEIMDLPPAAPFGLLGFSEVEQQLVTGLTMPIDAPRYGFGDSQDGPPVIDPPGTDPVGMGSLQVTFAPGQIPPPGMGDQMYLVSQGDLAAGGPTTLIWVEFGSNVDLTAGLSINEGAVLARPSRLGGWQSTFEADTWISADLFPTAMYSPEPFSFTMFEFAAKTIGDNPEFPGFILRDQNYLIVGVDTTALTADDPLETIGFGFHLHHATAPFTPGVVTAYPPPRDRTPEMFPGLFTNEPLAPGTYMSFPAPVEEPTETPAEDEPVDTPTDGDTGDGAVEQPVDTPTDGDTVAQPDSEATDEPAQEDGAGSDGGGSALLVVLVIIGILLVVAGLLLWSRSRTRERRGSGPGTGLASTPGEEGSGDSGEPRDVVAPVPVEHTTCDWELHYWTGAKWEVLRPAPFPAMKCCVYKVRVETKVKRHEQAAGFRQDVQPERLYIPDYDYAWRALDFDANTSTRSGPRGRLDWMHGLGDPIEQSDQAPAEAYWQSAQGEEPPEVASHLAHEETTRISITLEPGCPEPENTYVSSGDSTLAVMTTHECTNDDPAPECPVELNAFGWQWGEVWGELNWFVADAQGTDPDELERLVIARQKMDPEERSATPAKVPVHRTWDSHDHQTRDRLAYEGGDFDSGSDTKKSLTWTTWVGTEVELDAGQLVPQHVWPTTERVTAHIEQSMTHSIKVSGEMDKGDCESKGCCTGNPGHVCNCTPEFELTVDSSVSKIEVDGKSFAIDRDPPSADRRNPPAAGPDYQAWKLA